MDTKLFKIMTAQGRKVVGLSYGQLSMLNTGPAAQAGAETLQEKLLDVYGLPVREFNLVEDDAGQIRVEARDEFYLEAREIEDIEPLFGRFSFA
ncbi:MAG: hypothetical protein OER96_00870 [Gammaproteobacteria bacterium]|nr:hypothetical protein [Gammaproteobacteria bacterium]